MRISIVIPIFNVKAYINDCLISLIAQTYKEFEVIFVDDGSSDNSPAMAEESSKNSGLTFRIIHQTNQGLSAARNTGIKAAKGDYIIFLDSDDWLEDHAIATLSQALTGEDIVCFNGRRYFEATHSFEEADAINIGPYTNGWDYYSKNALLHRNFAFVCVVLRAYRRDFLISNNLFFKPGIKHEDNLFTPLACFYAKTIRVIPDILYVYRIRNNSIMTTRGIQNRKDIISTANELSYFFSKKNGITKNTVYRALTHYYQTSFSKCDHKTDKELLPFVDWEAYKIVSRTKLRHRIQYAAMRISPRLFRFVNSL